MGMKSLPEFNDCAALLKAMADPERLRIVTELFEGPRTVSELTSALGDEMVRVSHHLGVLRSSKIVIATKRGRFVEYALNPEVRVQAKRSGPRQIDFGCCCIDIS